MVRYQRLAADIIIDDVCEIILRHYDRKPKNLTEDRIENPILINGTIYYDLEEKVVYKIREIKE